MPRGSYTKVSAADRARIVECADGGGDWKTLCANLWVNPKTAHGWIKSAQEWRPHTGSRRKTLAEEQVDAICGMIEEDQGITLKALKGRILADFQLNVAISTIHNYLEGRLLTLKKVHYIAADANNARNKAALRVEYVQAIRAHMQDNKTIIWTDETNVNLYCRRTQGRVPALGVGEQRLQYVETQIDESMAMITPQDCARYCQHADAAKHTGAARFFAAVLRNEDMAPVISRPANFCFL